MQCIVMQSKDQAVKVTEGRGHTSGVRETALHESCVASYSDVNLHLGKSIFQALRARP